MAKCIRKAVLKGVLSRGGERGGGPDKLLFFRVPQAAFIYSPLPLKEVKPQPEEDLSETGIQKCC